MTCDEYAKLLTAVTASAIAILGAVGTMIAKRSSKKRSGRLDISSAKSAERGAKK